MVLEHLCMPSVIASSLVASCSTDFLNSSCRQPPSLPSRTLHLLFPFLRVFFLEVCSSQTCVVRTQPKSHHFRNTLSDYNIERAFLLVCFPSLVFSIRFLNLSFFIAVFPTSVALFITRASMLYAMFMDICPEVQQIFTVCKNECLSYTVTVSTFPF